MYLKAIPDEVVEGPIPTPSLNKTSQKLFQAGDRKPFLFGTNCHYSIGNDRNLPV